MSFLDRILDRHQKALSVQPAPVEWAEDLTNAGRFEAFHRANPHLLVVLRDMALAVKAQGIPRVGMKALFEQLRWHYYVKTTGEIYKLANTHTAYYSRVLMQWCPALDGFFSLRFQPAEPTGSYQPRWRRLQLKPGGGGGGRKPTRQRAPWPKSQPVSLEEIDQ